MRNAAGVVLGEAGFEVAGQTNLALVGVREASEEVGVVQRDGFLGTLKPSFALRAMAGTSLRQRSGLRAEALAKAGGGGGS